MIHNRLRLLRLRFWQSTSGITIPVTFLMLFVSLILIVSATYCYAAVKISAKGTELKVSVAKQNMILLDKSINSVAWSTGASQTFHFDDCGGQFRIEPTVKRLVVNLTDGNSINDIVFNNSVGKTVYELPSSEQQYANLFLKGDNRAVINQTSSTMTQLLISNGAQFQEATLSYRPQVSCSATDTSSQKPVNNVRIYILNLNASESLAARGDFYLKIASIDVSSTAWSYNLTYSVSSFAVNASIDGITSTVWIPIISDLKGAIINVEIVACNIRLGRGA